MALSRFVGSFLLLLLGVQSRVFRTSQRVVSVPEIVDAPPRFVDADILGGGVCSGPGKCVTAKGAQQSKELCLSYMFDPTIKPHQSKCTWTPAAGGAKEKNAEEEHRNACSECATSLGDETKLAKISKERKAACEQKVGMVCKDLGLLQQYANEKLLLIVVRQSTMDTVKLIASGDYATKSVDVHDKSSDWGPMRGLVTPDPYFCKKGNIKEKEKPPMTKEQVDAISARAAQAAKGFNADQQTGAKAVVLIKTVEKLEDMKECATEVQPNCPGGKALCFQDASGKKAPDDGSSSLTKGLQTQFCLKGEGEEKEVHFKDDGKLHPLMVWAYKDEEKGFAPVTGDYDLWTLSPHVESELLKPSADAADPADAKGQSKKQERPPQKQGESCGDGAKAGKCTDNLDEDACYDNYEEYGGKSYFCWYDKGRCKRRSYDCVPSLLMKDAPDAKEGASKKVNRLIYPYMQKIYGGQTTSTDFIVATFKEMNDKVLNRKARPVFHHGPESNNFFFLQALSGKPGQEGLTFIVPDKFQTKDSKAYTGSILTNSPDSAPSPLAQALVELNNKGFILLMNPLYNSAEDYSDVARAEAFSMVTPAERKDIQLVQEQLTSNQDNLLQEQPGIGLLQHIYARVRYMSIRKKNYVYQANQCRCIEANKEGDKEGGGVCSGPGKCETAKGAQKSKALCLSYMFDPTIKPHQSKCTWKETPGQHIHAADMWLERPYKVEDIRADREKFDCWDHDDGSRTPQEPQMSCKTLFPGDQQNKGSSRHAAKTAEQTYDCLKEHTTKFWNAGNDKNGWMKTIIEAYPDKLTRITKTDAQNAKKKFDDEFGEMTRKLVLACFHPIPQNFFAK